MKYKVTFTPSGAYFFGNEKRFEFGKSSSLYFISGEPMPSQSTLLGALRYILLPEKGFDKLKKAENIEAIGESGYDMDSDKDLSYGKIKSISPVFICKGDEIFIPTPFDHNCAKPETKLNENGEIIEYYTPMTEYVKFENPASNGQTVYLADYDVKCDLADSFMSIEDKRLEKNLFTTDVRVGIDKKKNKDAFFKKAYKCLKNGFGFCVYAVIDDDSMECKNEVVVLGQGKVPFGVKFEKVEESTSSDVDVNKEKDWVIPPEIEGKIKSSILIGSHEYNKVYCLSDMLATGDIYKGCAMAIVKTKDYRSFYTQNYTNCSKYKRGGILHRLVKAGSVFVYEEKVDSLDKKPENTIDANKLGNAKKVGFNKTIYIDEKKEN